MSQAPEERIPARVYLITPPVIEDLEAFATLLEEAFSGGDIACVQLRLKDVDDGVILAAANRLMPIVHDHQAAFLINDRPDLAKLVDADGVHLGQDDGDVRAARTLLGFDREIGVTCHDSRHLAFEAGEAGADYVAFGAFYPTDTKDAPTKAAPETLKLWTEVAEIPCVAIGGITADNLSPLIAAGADFVAVSGYVWSHPAGPAAAISALNAAIEAAETIA